MNHGQPKPPRVELPAWLSPLAVSLLVNQKPFPFATMNAGILTVHQAGKLEQPKTWLHDGSRRTEPVYLWDESEEAWRRVDPAPKTLRESRG